MSAKDFVDKERNRSVKPLKGYGYEGRGQNEAKKPIFKSSCHLALLDWCDEKAARTHITVSAVAVPATSQY